MLIVPEICRNCSELGTVSEFDVLKNKRETYYFCWKKFDKLTNSDVKKCENFKQIIQTKKNCAYYCDKNSSTCAKCKYWVRDIIYINDQETSK